MGDRETFAVLAAMLLGGLGLGFVAGFAWGRPSPRGCGRCPG